LAILSLIFFKNTLKRYYYLIEYLDYGCKNGDQANDCINNSKINN